MSNILGTPAYLRQKLELGPVVDVELALENAPRGRPFQRLMGLIDDQQLDIGPRVVRLKAMPTILRHSHLPGRRIAVDQPRDLRPAPPVIFSM